MLSALALILLSQTQPAVRRSTPLADDPGMVTRNIPSGTQNVNVVGGGPLIPGSPDGGLIGTVIAIGPDGGAVPVQGSISATNPSVGPTASTVPAQATLVGGPDSSNLLRAPFVLTTTPDAGDPGLVVRVVGGISGGGGGGGTVTQGPGQDGGAWAVDTELPAPAALSDSVANPTTPLVGSALMGWEPGASSWNRVRTSPVNADGEVAHTQGALDTMSNNYFFNGTAWDRFRGTIAGGLLVDVSDLFVLDSTFTARLNTLGQKTMVGSAPVVIASDQSAVPISGTVMTTPPANASTNVTQFGGNAVATGTGVGGLGVPRVTVSSDSTVGVTGTVTVTGSVTANAGTNLNTSALALETTLGTRLADATFTGRINTLGQKTMAASTPVVVASDQSALNVTPAPLADVTGAGTLNALNAVCSITLTGRRGASFFVAAGTLAATTVGEVSPDGTNWFPTLFVNQSTFVVLASSVTTNPNPAAMFTPYLPAGTVAARLRVASFGSGSATCTSRASDNVPNLITPTTQVDSVVSSTGLVNVVGALDNTTDFPASLRGSTTPADNSAFGIAVRPVLKSAASVAAKNVSCGTSATSLTSSPLSNRQSVTFFNNGTNTIFIGPTGVTTAAGLPLLPGAYFQDDINSPQEYFCVVAAGTEPMRVLEN